MTDTTDAREGDERRVLFSERTPDEHVAWARARALEQLDDDTDGLGVDRALTTWAEDLGAFPGTADRADEVRCDAVAAAVRELNGSTPAGEPQAPRELVRAGIKRFQAVPRFGSGASKGEHLAACRQRALAELDADPEGCGPINAMTSMTSDLGKHPEARHRLNGISGMAPMGAELEMLEVLTGIRGPGVLRTAEQLREWIGGFR